MLRVGTWAVAVAVVGATLWAGLALTAQEPKPVDLADLREAVDAAAKRGDNVDAIRKALDAFAKVAPGVKAGTAPAELQALRDAVEAAARKGEDVEAIAKELTAVEMAVAGKSLARPRPQPVPEPVPDPNPNPFNPGFNRPFVRPVPFPEVPFPNPPAVGGIDAQSLQKAMDLRIKAMELMAANPRDPEARKLLQEANEQMLKALRGAAGGRMPLPPALPDIPEFPNFPALPDFDRIPVPNLDPFGQVNRPRLGVTVERLSPVLVEQLGLDPNVGVAIASVLPGSVAEKSGLKAHDIVIEFAGQPVTAATDEFVRRVGAAKAGEKLDLVVLRKGKKVEIKGVVLPDLGRAPAAPDLPPVFDGAVPPRRPLPVAPPELPRNPAVKPGLKPLPNPVPPVPEPSVPQVKPIIDEAPVRAVTAAQAPDLADLRDEVAAAEKGGANVGEVRAALTALDKALAKGVKGGEPLPELTALRAAVEKALKKGEAVDGVSRELESVEKALTGRAFERPVPEPVPEPALPPPAQFPRRGGFGRAQGGVVIGGNGGVVIGGAGMNGMSVVISNDRFVIRARRGDVNYTVSGSTAPDGAVTFTIKDGEKTVEADDLKKVPEAYRPTVEELLKSVRR